MKFSPILPYDRLIGKVMGAKPVKIATKPQPALLCASIKRRPLGPKISEFLPLCQAFFSIICQNSGILAVNYFYRAGKGGKKPIYGPDCRHAAL